MRTGFSLTEHLKKVDVAYTVGRVDQLVEHSTAHVGLVRTEAKPFSLLEIMVAGDRIELSTQGFSVLCSTN